MTSKDTTPAIGVLDVDGLHLPTGSLAPVTRTYTTTRGGTGSPNSG